MHVHIAVCAHSQPSCTPVQTACGSKAAVYYCKQRIVLAVTHIQCTSLLSPACIACWHPPFLIHCLSQRNYSTTSWQGSIQQVNSRQQRAVKGPPTPSAGHASESQTTKQAPANQRLSHHRIPCHLSQPCRPRCTCMDSPPTHPPGQSPHPPLTRTWCLLDCSAQTSHMPHCPHF